MTKKFYSYEEFIKDIEILNSKLANSDIVAIVGLARGGLTFAHFLSEKLNIRELYSVQAISYNGEHKLAQIKISNLPDLSHLAKGKILLVDDISDSGRTLTEVNRLFSEKYINLEIITATLFLGEKSTFEPTFWLHKNSDWIIFFWSYE